LGYSSKTKVFSYYYSPSSDSLSAQLLLVWLRTRLKVSTTY